MLHFIKYLFDKSARYRFVLLFLLLMLFQSSAALAQRVQNANVRPARPARLNVQYHRAEKAWRSGSSLLEARARIDRVLIELPMDAEARKLRAGIFLSMGTPEKALEDALAAVELDPLDGEAQLLVCEAAVRSGDQLTALSALVSSADLLLDQSTFHVRLSRCAVDLGKFDAAEAYARTALAGNARNAKAHLQLARVFILTEENDKAVTVLSRAIQAKILSTVVIRQDTLFSDIMQELR